MLKDKLVVCTTSQTHLQYKPYWDTFPLHFTYLTDVTKNPSYDVGLRYTEETVREDMMFEEDIPKGHFYAHQGRSIIWFYAQFRMSLYYNMKPDFNNYWFMDDDVTVGDPEGFFSAFEDNDADFLAYYLFKEQSVDTQPNIPKLDNRTYSGNGWFDRFPGPGDILYPDTTELFGSFFPIVRISNNFLNKMTTLSRMGLHGWHEGYVPTSVNYFGGKLDTIFNSDGLSDHFDAAKIDVKHKNQTIGWDFL